MQTCLNKQIIQEDSSDFYLDSILKIDTWVKREQYQGYEPFDGLSSWLRPLTFKRNFLMRCLEQIVLRSPFNIRPLLGVGKKESTKAMGCFSQAYTRLYHCYQDPVWKDKATHCLDWLCQNTSQKYHGACWGNHFDYASRAFYLPKFVPTAVWTSLIGHAFLEAYDTFQKQKWLDMAVRACEFILRDLPREKSSEGFCLSYVPFRQVSIHNANMLGASLLARTYSYTKKDELGDIATQALRYSVSHQREDGSWYYGNEKKYWWIDSWHTAYKLDSLKWYSHCVDSDCFRLALDKGYKFYKNNFFEYGGIPKYYWNETYPIDIQCASQAIDTLSNFSDEDPDALTLALSVANWTIQNMQDTEGYFIYRKLPHGNINTPMLHWGQATMMSGLTHLMLKCYNREMN